MSVYLRKKDRIYSQKSTRDNYINIFLKNLESKILIDFFFFNEIEYKGRTRMMQPLLISKDPCITEEKGKLIK